MRQYSEAELIDRMLRGPNVHEQLLLDNWRRHDINALIARTELNNDFDYMRADRRRTPKGMLRIINIVEKDSYYEQYKRKSILWSIAAHYDDYKDNVVAANRIYEEIGWIPEVYILEKESLFSMYSRWLERTKGP